MNLRTYIKSPYYQDGSEWYWPKIITSVYKDFLTLTSITILTLMSRLIDIIIDVDLLISCICLYNCPNIATSLTYTLVMMSLGEVVRTWWNDEGREMMKLLQPNLLTWCRDGAWDDECKPWDGVWWNPYFLPTNPNLLSLVYNMRALCWDHHQTLIHDH